MYLPAEVLTPEVDFRLSKTQRELRLTGDCAPLAASPFFQRILGDRDDFPTAGLRRIVGTCEEEQLWLVCTLRRINTDAERAIEALCVEFLGEDTPLHIRWIVPEGEVNTRRIGRGLRNIYPQRVEIVDPEGTPAA